MTYHPEKSFSQSTSKATDPVPNTVQSSGQVRNMTEDKILGSAYRRLPAAGGIQSVGALSPLL